MQKEKKEIRINRESILNLKLLSEEVFLKQLGASVWVKVLSGPEHRLFRKLCAEDKEKDADGAPVSIMTNLIALATISETGEQLFSIDDRAAIDELPQTVQTAIFKRAAVINGLTDESIEDRVKN